MFRCQWNLLILVAGFVVVPGDALVLAQNPSATPRDYSEEDPGFDDYHYAGDYRLRDRWWLTGRAGVAADQLPPRREESAPPATDDRQQTDLPQRVTVPEAYSLDEEVYGEHRPYYTRVSPWQDIQAVPNYSDPFRWRAPTLRPNYVLPPVPFFAETLPEERRSPLYGPQPAYRYYDYKNYYEGGGYSRDDEPGIGIWAR